MHHLSYIEEAGNNFYDELDPAEEKDVEDKGKEIPSLLDFLKETNRIANRMYEKERLDDELKEMCNFKKKFLSLKKVTLSIFLYASGNFGFFKERDANRSVDKTRRESIKKHFDNPLHQWCEDFEKRKNESREEFEIKCKPAKLLSLTQFIGLSIQ